MKSDIIFFMNSIHPAWVMLDDFGDWLQGQIKRTAYFKWQKAGCPENQDLYFWTEAQKEFKLPQAIGEVMGSGYGADDPFLKSIIKHYKETHE